MLEIAGFRLGMTPEQALAVCNRHGQNHTRVFNVVDAAGAMHASMPMPDPVPTADALLQRMGVQPPTLAGPYQSTLFCTWRAGFAELSFSAPPSNGVSTVRFTSNALPISKADYGARLVVRYGPPSDQIGPENTQRLRPTDGLTTTSMKWLATDTGLDCAPRIRSRTAVSSESQFTPFLPLGSSGVAQCKAHLTVRITGDANPIGEFTLSNLSAVIDEDDRFWAELKLANPSIRTPTPGRRMNTESAELACEAMKFVGCRQSNASVCQAELAFVNRTRHVISGANAPTERTLYQCLSVATTVEQARACGVACEATPDARHASVGATFPTEFFTAACENMNQLQCGARDLGQCALALQSKNDGWFNADCLESARTQEDVLYCGGSCGVATSLATLYTGSFASACANLKAHQCSVGASKTCENDLRKILPILRHSRPNPHECLDKARGPIEIARCGVACLPPKANERE